ncbi:MAG TPA: DUF6760 family protein [Pyrinomonadaceae bacterium]
MRRLRPALPDDPGLDRFFYGAAGSEEQLRQEVFFLSYHLHWGHDEVMGLATAERRRFVRMLNETLETQNEEVQRARRRTSA